MAARAHRTARRPPMLRAAHRGLPWWSLALPAAAFAALLALALHGGGAPAPDAVEPLARLLTRIAQVLPG